MDQRQRQANRHGRHAHLPPFARDAQHGHDEDEGQHKLGDEARGCGIFSRRVRGVAIGRHRAGCDVRAGRAGGNECEQAGCTDSAAQLGGHVRDDFRPADPASDRRTERDGRVQVRAGDRTERIGHGEHRQAEGQRYPKHPDATFRLRRGQYRRTAAAECQPKRTKCFRKELLRRKHDCFRHGSWHDSPCIPMD
ncbi:hypothetical protein FQZ97_895870 [compost metagenome]